jgi:hypothetical protein
MSNDQGKTEFGLEEFAPFESGFRFKSSAICHANLVFTSMYSQPLQQLDVPHAAFFAYEEEQFFAVDGLLHWDCVSICAIEDSESLVALGQEGQVRIYSGPDQVDERITDEEDAVFCEVRLIQDTLFACGLDRRVHRREGPEAWTALPAVLDLGEEPEPDIVFGFESIDGHAADDVYAVGWHGEIWHFDGTAWTQQDSPTTTVLTRVLCAPDGHVYACGLGGVLVRGRRGGTWERVGQGAAAADEDLWDLAWFQDTVWASSRSGLHTLQGADLQPVVFDDSDAHWVPRSFHRLDARHGLLWSTSEREVMQFDGTRWSRITGD